MTDTTKQRAAFEAWLDEFSDRVGKPMPDEIFYAGYQAALSQSAPDVATWQARMTANDFYRVTLGLVDGPVAARDDEIRDLRAALASRDKDSERYKLLRRKVAIAGGKFHILNLDPTYCAPSAEIELDAVIDAALKGVSQ
jgi:hypothetical protein